VIWILTSSVPPAAERDEDVVRLVLAGNTAMFELLMRRYNERVYRAARAILRDDEEAEDVMQQAYVNAFTHLRQFNGDARFSTWLLRITVNEALARARRRGRYEPYQEDEAAERDLRDLHEQVQMVGHPTVGVKCGRMLRQGIGNQPVEGTSISFAEEYRLPVIAAERYMIETAGNVQPRPPRHGESAAFSGA